jgi:nucleoside-diphosphate-sugar epimerase
LGLPLAESLLKKGYRIHGSTTSEEKIGMLQHKGIDTFLVSLTEKGVRGDLGGFLSGIEILIINIPPKLKGPKQEDYVMKMKFLLKAIQASDIGKIIFVSSTSVYGSLEGEVTETTIPRPSSESGRQLLATERLFQDEIATKSTVVRFGGLIGNDRHPIHHLKGKKDLKNGQDPVNLIHQNDCVRILEHIILYDWWDEIFNGAYPYHPTKADYYRAEAQKRNLQPPVYGPVKEAKGKKIVSPALTNVKMFVYQTSIVT